VCMIYCGVFRVLETCCVICSLQIFGVSILQLVGFFRLQIVGLISSSLVLGFQCPSCCIFGDFNLQIVGFSSV